MRNKDKKQEKSKEFSNAPFRGLKGFAAGTEAPQPEKASREVKRSTHHEADDDSEEFLRYVEGVRKLDREEERKNPDRGGGDNKVASPEEEERRMFISSINGMDVTFRDEIPDTEPLRPMPANRMRQLKTGTIRIDLELDLHGLTKEEALDNLGRFVTGAYNRGQKAILVITGKGNNSPAEPVLQGAVASWLREAGKKMVAEFAPAPRRMGGSGAFVVFLKEIKRSVD